MIHYYYQEQKDSKKESECKHRTYRQFVIKYCEQCNSELISEGFGYNVNEYTSAFRASWKLSHCPICGAELARKENYHFASTLFMGENKNPHASYSHPHAEMGGAHPVGSTVITQFGRGVVDDNSAGYCRVSYYDSDNLESMLEYLSYFREKAFEEAAENRLNIFLEEATENALRSLKDFSRNLPTELEKYLSQILMVETNIYAITKRLQQLYTIDIVAEKEAFGAERIVIANNNKLVEKALHDYETIKSTDVTSKITKDQFAVMYPNKPVEPIKPNYPIFAKPTLFNKRRVLAENAELEKKYQDDLRQYEAAYEQYQSALEEYYAKVEELKKEQQTRYSEAMQEAQAKHNAKCEKAEKAYNATLQKKKHLEQSAQNIKTPQRLKCLLLQEEIKLAEETLKKHYIVRSQLYACGIVFEKYRNLAAIAQMYEYISSSRCDKLEGANGAYNLYENEIRMNMVISQLTQIVESLEQIKSNQYMIYSAVSKTNRQLDKLNTSMNRAVESLAHIETTNEIIANNSEIIAYNTEQTAFYAKKNAELTDALGYMAAFR